MDEDECVFCKIVSGEEKAWIVYRGPSVMILLDPYPVTRGHTLIIPIHHYESMFDIPDRLLGRIISLSQKLCKLYRKRLSIQGVSIEVLNHEKKRRRFSHFHLHVIPRYNIRNKRDPANVKPSQTWPREPDTRLDRALGKVRPNTRLAL